MYIQIQLPDAATRCSYQMQLLEAARLKIYAVASTAASDFLAHGDELNEALLRCVNSLNTQTVQATIRQKLYEQSLRIPCVLSSQSLHLFSETP